MEDNGIIDDKANTAKSFDGVKMFIRGSLKQYASIWQGTAAFVCYIAGAGAATLILAMLSTLFVTETNPGIIFTLSFMVAVAAFGIAGATFKAVSIGKNMPTREQRHAMNFGKLVNAEIKQVKKKYRRHHTASGSSSFANCFYYIDYTYRDENGATHDGKFKYDTTELSDEYFYEGGYLTVAFFGGHSIPIKEYELLSDTAELPTEVSERLDGTPKAKGKLRPLNDASRDFKLGLFLILAAMIIVGAEAFAIISTAAHSTPLDIVRTVLLILLVSCIHFTLLIGFACVKLCAAHTEHSRFNDLRKNGTLAYAAISNEATNNEQNRRYFYVYGSNICEGVIPTRKLDSHMEKILVDSLPSPYIKILVLFSDSDSMIVY